MKKSRAPTLAEYIDQQKKLCTHVCVIRNGEEPRFEAVTHISPDQIAFMVDVWTAQYYKAQELKHLEAEALRRVAIRTDLLNRKHRVRTPSEIKGFLEYVKAAKAALGEP